MKTLMSSLKTKYTAWTEAQRDKDNTPLEPSGIALTTGIILTVIVGFCLIIGGIYLTYFQPEKQPEAVEVFASQSLTAKGGKLGGATGSTVEPADADCPKVSICNGVGSSMNWTPVEPAVVDISGGKLAEPAPAVSSDSAKPSAPAPALSVDAPVVADESTTSETFQAPQSPEPSLNTETDVVVPVPAEPVAPATPAVPAEETVVAPEVPQTPEVPADEPVLVPTPEAPVLIDPPVDGVVSENPPVIYAPEAPADEVVSENPPVIYAPDAFKVIEAYCPADVLMMNAWYHPDCAVSTLVGTTNSGMTPVAGYVIYRWTGPNDGVERSPLDPAWAIETVVGQ